MLTSTNNVEPMVKFDFNQKFLVALDHPEIEVIPCLTHVDHQLREVPRKAWITYKGLADMLGTTYMRFEYDGEDLLLPFSVLDYLEEVPHRFPGEKVKRVDHNKKFVTKPKFGRKFVTHKTAVTSTKKNKKRIKKRKSRIK